MKRLMIAMCVSIGALCAFARNDLDCSWFYSQHVTDAYKGLPRVFIVGGNLPRRVFTTLQKELLGRATITSWDTNFAVGSEAFDDTFDVYLRTHNYEAVILDDTELKGNMWAAIDAIRQIQPKARIIRVSALKEKPTVPVLAKELEPCLSKTVLTVTEAADAPAAACTKWAYPIHPAIGGRENIEWSTFYGFDLLDEKRPRVFLIGDSITQSYYNQTRAIIKGKANMTVWANSYSNLRPEYLSKLEIFLKNYTFDVIHFSIGGHGFPSQEKYEEGMRAALAVIRRVQPKAKIVIVTPTQHRDRSKNDRALGYREVCHKLASEFKLVLNELGEYADSFDRSEYHDECHFEKPAQQKLANRVAEVLLKQLGQ